MTTFYRLAQDPNKYYSKTTDDEQLIPIKAIVVLEGAEMLNFLKILVDELITTTYINLSILNELGEHKIKGHHGFD